MSKRPILDPTYWKQRLEAAPPDAPHHAIFKCGTDQWRRIEERHRAILARHVDVAESVIDVGCGWGRLLELMPPEWYGWYHGIDLSPDFIAMAKARHPKHEFAVCKADDLGTLWTFDWAVLISIRPMVRRELGGEEWAKMEAEVRRVSRRQLYLEYDENDEGNVE